MTELVAIETELDIREQAICLSWVSSYNVTEVARTFGTNTSTIYATLRRPDATKYVQELMAEGFTGAIITADFIKTHYLHLLPKVLGEVDINMTTASGDQITGKKFDSAAVLGILRDMSKTVEGFDKSKDKAESGGVQVNINMGNLLGQVPMDIEVIEHE